MAKRTARARGIALSGIKADPPPVARRRRVGPSGGLKAVTRVEFLVSWQREGLAETSKRFGSKKRAMDRIGIMTSDEPWRHFGSVFERTRTADELTVKQLEKGGEYQIMTLREEADARRQGMPKLEWVAVERRYVTRTAWHREDDDTELIPATFRRR
jgi:hypothetical protein